MDANSTKAITELTQLISAIDRLMVGAPYDAGHTRWLFNARSTMNRWLGAQSELTRSFSSLDYRTPGGTLISGYDPIHAAKEQRIESYREQLQTAKGVLQSAVDQLTEFGLNEMRAGTGLSVASDNKNVLVSHGGKPPMLAKVERIVRVLGFNPIVVEQEPSSGMAVDDLVREQMRSCICAIILATRDDENPTSRYPRPNVVHEIGLAQEILKDKVIYLKEDGLDFPSNVAPKVWEPFTNENPDPVWDKIVRELRGFGFIQ